MRRALAVLMALGAGACAPHAGGDGGVAPDAAVAPDLSSPPPEPFCTDGVDGGPPATLASVEQLFHANCALSGCHDAGPLAAPVHLDLRPGHVRASVVNVPAFEASCGGTRVVPGDPASSYLLHKLADPDPCAGATCTEIAGPAPCLQMPRCEIGSCPLPACAIAVVHDWIAAGATP